MPETLSKPVELEWRTFTGSSLRSTPTNDELWRSLLASTTGGITTVEFEYENADHDVVPISVSITGLDSAALIRTKYGVEAGIIAEGWVLRPVTIPSECIILVRFERSLSEVGNERIFTCALEVSRPIIDDDLSYDLANRSLRARQLVHQQRPVASAWGED